MTSETLLLQIRLMAREAGDRLSDAAILSSAVQTRSDSAYLLQLLAFEILLKATLRIYGIDATQGHRYDELFGLLAPNVRARLVEAASSRMARAGDFSRLDELLTTWSRNFVDLRYPYERYDGMTPEEYSARGEAWVAGGAEESQAAFVYHPVELDGLTHALQVEVDRWLRARTA